MEILKGNFSSIQNFNLNVVNELADYFDIDYSKKNVIEFNTWFLNLSKLAEENLGLAHSVLHNQTARNCINLAYKKTGLSVFNRPYNLHIGTYSFFKGFGQLQESVTLDNNFLSGTKLWASHLENSDFIILNVLDKNEKLKVKKVFLDLTKVEYQIIKDRTDPIGMKIAAPSDLYISTTIPNDWILEPNEFYYPINSFHYYGLTWNYIATAKSIIKQAIELGYKIDYNLKKLNLNLDISQKFQECTLQNIIDYPEKKHFTEITMQHQFARKNLIDVVSFFLEIMNTGFCDSKSLYSQKFRDSLTMITHIVNLYKHLNGSISRW